MPAAVTAGTVVAAANVETATPLLSWSVAAVTGGGAAAVVQAGTTLLRGASTLATAGLGNPVVSTAENGGALGLSLLALTVPVLALSTVLVLVAVVRGGRRRPSWMRVYRSAVRRSVAPASAIVLILGTAPAGTDDSEASIPLGRCRRSVAPASTIVLILGTAPAGTGDSDRVLDGLSIGRIRRGTDSTGDGAESNDEAVEMVSSVGLGVGLAAACPSGSFCRCWSWGWPPGRLSRVDRGLRMDGGDARPADRRGGDGVRGRRLLRPVARQPAADTVAMPAAVTAGTVVAAANVETAAAPDWSVAAVTRGGGRRPGGYDPAARRFDSRHRRSRQPRRPPRTGERSDCLFLRSPCRFWRCPPCSCWSPWWSSGSGGMHPPLGAGSKPKRRLRRSRR